jgi:hypothetical protein
MKNNLHDINGILDGFKVLAVFSLKLRWFKTSSRWMRIELQPVTILKTPKYYTFYSAVG